MFLKILKLMVFVVFAIKPKKFQLL